MIVEKKERLTSMNRCNVSRSGQRNQDGRGFSSAVFHGERKGNMRKEIITLLPQVATQIGTD